MGLYLLSTMHADTPIPVLWAYMFVTGIGVGPTFAVFILIVQNSVPIARLGAASSSLTFFQQVGGTVGLAITGTIFASAHRRAGAAPGRRRGRAAPAGGDDGRRRPGRDQLTAVGDLGAAILGGVPEAARAQVEPFIPTLVNAIYEAFSLATASTFTVGIVTSLVAAGLVLLLREAPAPATEQAPASASAVASRGRQQADGGRPTGPWWPRGSRCRSRSRTTSCQVVAARRSEADPGAGEGDHERRGTDHPRPAAAGKHAGGWHRQPHHPRR